MLKKCGIQATSGGMLQFQHLEQIRKHSTLKMDTKRMHAIWRIDSPWRACSKKPQNSRMGG
ncbi:MAG: mitochondrial ribosomal large subunit component, partial [Paramarteilia canceri]